MTARLIQRLRGEHGMALVLAVLVLVIVSILTTAVIAYTTTNQQDAASKKSGVSAYALAQAALSNATAQLTSHYYDSTGQPFDNTTSLTTMASTWAPTAPNGGVGQQSPSSSAACTATSSCMSWSGILLCPVTVTCAGGGSPYTPSGVKQAAWRITATGRIPNPSGPGFLSRTITVDVPVEAPPAKAPVPDIFKSVYSGASTTGCDLSTGQGVHFSSPVYVVGNLCLGQHSSIEAGPENLGKLVVGGWIEIDQQANIGTNANAAPERRRRQVVRRLAQRDAVHAHAAGRPQLLRERRRDDLRHRVLELADLPDPADGQLDAAADGPRQLVVHERALADGRHLQPHRHLLHVHHRVRDAQVGLDDVNADDQRQHLRRRVDGRRRRLRLQRARRHLRRRCDLGRQQHVDLPRQHEPSRLPERH
jgi:Tfp pilus assembly protein PilX